MAGAPDRIDSSAAGRQAFARYIDAFNEGRTEDFTSYYTPDVKLHLASRTLEGPAQVRQFYSAMYQTVREQLTVHRVIADDHGVCIEITATFTAHADAPDFLVAPLRQGERVSGHMFVVYRIENGQFSDIRVARIGAIGAVASGDDE